MKIFVFALLCALLQLNFALEDELVADTTIEKKEDELDVEKDPIYGLGRWGGLGYGGRIGGWGYGRGIGRVWDDEESDEDVESDEDAVVGLRGLGRMGHLGLGHRLGLGLHGLRSHRMGLHGLGMLGRRHGLGSLRRGLWDEDEIEDEENDAILGRRHGLGGWGGRLGGWGLRGLRDEEAKEELLNQPPRGESGNFRCLRCRRRGRKWYCRTCRGLRNEDEVSDLMLEEDELLNEPQRGRRVSFFCRNCGLLIGGRFWKCDTCRRERNEDEVSDLMLTGRRMGLIGCRGLGCMRRMCSRCGKVCRPCLRCPLGRMCRRVCRRVLC